MNIEPDQYALTHGNDEIDTQCKICKRLIACGYALPTDTRKRTTTEILVEVLARIEKIHRRWCEVRNTLISEERMREIMQEILGD